LVCGVRVAAVGVDWGAGLVGIRVPNSGEVGSLVVLGFVVWCGCLFVSVESWVFSSIRCWEALN
jgi:hypothetical protein